MLSSPFQATGASLRAIDSFGITLRNIDKNTLAAGA
jgi:hypothetical protein